MLALVAAAVLAGIGHASGTQTATSGGVAFIQSVRGAGEPFVSRTTTYDIGQATPFDEQILLDRAAHAQVPTSQAPLPTPLAIDPDATPLPGPEDAKPAIGQTAGSTTSRAPAPGPAPTTLLWPVPGGSISQYYHAGHLALDIAAPYGTTIIAAQAGVVTSAGWRNNGGGYVIQIDHGNGMTTVYNHLSSIWVSAGQVVGAGQGIGGIGCTGTCTGPHVHFEVIVNGIIDNPLRYL
ncbi:MAG TPA: M23 family metallopeptidase [Candidatus Limnocylindria bacterium]|nr:M23 family metallopeptidase [Candidatus Limnocylindria bacterium]